MSSGKASRPRFTRHCRRPVRLHLDAGRLAMLCGRAQVTRPESSMPEGRPWVIASRELVRIQTASKVQETPTSPEAESFSPFGRFSRRQAESAMPNARPFSGTCPLMMGMPTLRHARRLRSLGEAEP